MMRAFRRFAQRYGLNLLLGVVLIGVGVSLLKPEPAAADVSCDDLKKVALSDVGLNQRLMALEVLKKDGGTAAVNALADIAGRGKLQVASGACAQLGRVHSTASKAKLKALLENSNLNVKVRMVAVSCIAEHWRDDGDISYLEDQCEGNAELEAHCASVTQRVFEH
jgi:Fe-S cluster biogenesis protein NfuA